ncbi:MAG: hypothetical protein ACJAUP_003302 [Cellvibrionaceae bacterium]|jgi:hypothetical protein
MKMMNVAQALGLASLLMLSAYSNRVNAAVEISGKLDIEATVYADEGQFTGQAYRTNFSIAAEPEFYWKWGEGDDSVTFMPFVRGDEHDDERSHGDIRELSWLHVNGAWEFRTGIRKVFWGVTEFNHLVDVINQTDTVDSFDGEEKLGQPMINISRVTDSGIVDFFILAGFRERTFAGEEGRLRSDIVVATDRARYASNDEEKHIDFALRWSHSIGLFDLGAYWFEGTDRDPLLQPTIVNGSLALVPYYQQASQFGMDLQATIDSWLLKFESIYKDSDSDNFAALQAGFEYSLYGLNQSATDLGLLLEYGWDERGQDASSIAQNDIYLGARLTFNDSKGTAILMGISYDADYYSKSMLIEASRRLNDRWTIALEGLLFEADNASDPVSSVDKDDRLQLTLERYF